MIEDRIFIGRVEQLDDFTAMVQRRVEYWVFALAGDGGIGKTRLLEQMIALAGDLGAVQSGLVDLYYTDLQTETGLLHALGSRLGWQNFPDLAETLEKSGTGPAKMREELLEIAADQFISGLRDLASERPVVLFFDTFEKATETGVSRWFLEGVLPRIRQSAVVVLAGRNTFELADGSAKATGISDYDPAVISLPLEEVHLVSLSPFSLREVQHYLKRYLEKRGEGAVPLKVDPERYADLEKPPAEVETIGEKSDGHPVIVALAADWLAEWGAGSIVEVADLSPEQFERAMVGKIRDLETPEDEAIVRMAHVYHRFNAGLLDAVYPELTEEDFTPEQVIESLSRFSFVKYRPKTGSCLLHDEMQRLVERYVWDEIDPARDVRREISANVVEYYDRILQGETDERTRWVLEAERIYHHLYTNLEEGRVRLWRTIDWAYTHYKLDFVKMLVSKGQEVNTRLNDPFLGVMCRAIRAWVNLEEWELEPARELAQSVIEDPASTERTRATTLAVLGVYADRKGESDRAIDHYQQALGIYRQLEQSLKGGETLPDERGIPSLSGVRAEIAMLLNSIGIVQRHRGEFDEAIESYEQALEVALQEKNQEWLAAVWNNIGNVERLRGNLDVARKLCEQALRFRKRLREDAQGTAYLRDVGLSYNTSGMVLRDMGELDEAEEEFKQAGEIFEQIHDRSGVARAIRNRGWVYYLRGKALRDKAEFGEALRYYERSRRICEEFHIEPELPNLLNKIGIAQRALGNTEAALESFAESLRLARDRGDNLFIANDLVRLAEMAYDAGDLQQVAEYADELRRFEEREFRFGLAYAEMEELQARIAISAGEYADAFHHLGENYAYLARLSRWRFNRKIDALREFFEALPDDEWRRRCGEQLIQFWKEQGLAKEYADLTAICVEYIMS